MPNDEYIRQLICQNKHKYCRRNLKNFKNLLTEAAASYDAIIPNRIKELKMKSK